MACHGAFEVDFYRQTAVVFSHSLGRKRAFTHAALSCLELLTIALTGKSFQVIWQLQLGVGGGFNQEMAMSAKSS